ncbi:MAG: branched-chain amino acid ABC transporter permease [Alphaproteobacteria bacterium]|nr:branched-chain amino acid ABC transporter permease [Alphaproteobacteria bacterium]MBV9559309.1 branched-chain amino acid ABC transporter permease [Bradyrhizobium sp.]
MLQYVIDALSLGSLYALTALGIGLLFGVLRVINFAHGDFISVGAYALIVPSANALAVLYVGALPWPLVLLLTAMSVIMVAILSELMVFRPLRGTTPATLMIGSFALSFIIQHLLLMIYGSRPKAVNLWPELTTQVNLLGLRVQKLQLATVGATAMLLGALTLLLRTTRTGVELRAAAEDYQMARMLGIRANTVIAGALALSGLLAATASLLYTAQSGILSYQMGVPLMMFAFISTVVGGLGNLLGAVVGAFVVAAIEVILQATLSDQLRPFREAFVFVLVIAILLWRPYGILEAHSSRERV